MRPIKFLAIYKDTIYTVFNLETSHMQNEGLLTIFNQKEGYIKIRREEVKLLQYINVNDKNGREIYESFHVTGKYTTGHDVDGEVIYRPGGFFVKSKDNTFYTFAFINHDSLEIK